MYQKAKTKTTSSAKAFNKSSKATRSC